MLCEFLGAVDHLGENVQHYDGISIGVLEFLVAEDAGHQGDVVAGGDEGADHRDDLLYFLGRGGDVGS
jgi:hypothetical protein